MRQLGTIAGAMLVLTLTACGGGRESRAVSNGPDLLPAVQKFLLEHPEFGEPASSFAVPDWANGKRQRVRFTSGRDLLFYTRNDRVMTVYEDAPGGRAKVWGETETYESPTPAAHQAGASLPAYTVLFSVAKYGGGGKFGDVLIPSYSRSTPAAERERVARVIAKKEGLADITIYSTREAYEANMSEKYSKAHPGALRKGFLGLLQDGTFTPAERLYP